MDDRAASSVPRLLLRLAVFAVIVLAGYLAIRQLTYIVFAPDLELVSAVVPGTRVAANAPVVVGARVVNTGRMDGAAFVLIALASGEYVEGGTVAVPAGDTVLVPVELSLPSGSHTLSLIIYDAWRGVRELDAVRGVMVRSVGRSIEVAGIRMPERFRRGEAATIEVSVINYGVQSTSVVPVVAFRSSNGPLMNVEGGPQEIPAGATATLRLDMEPMRIPAGRYIAEASARTGAGETIGYARYPQPFVVLD